MIAAIPRGPVGRSDDDAAWVDDQLRESTDDPARAEHAVQLVQSAGVTAARAKLLLDAVARGAINAESLARLLVRGVDSSVDRDTALRLVR